MFMSISFVYFNYKIKLIVIEWKNIIENNINIFFFSFYWFRNILNLFKRVELLIIWHNYFFSLINYIRSSTNRYVDINIVII